MPENSALWLTAGRKGFEVGPSAYTTPRDGEIVLRTRAVAINPVDWLTLLIGDLVFSWLRYPFIMGSDVAGEVVDVGPGVTRFAIGDRVLGHAIGTEKARNRAEEGGFQTYTVLLERMAAPIPASMPYETAAVLPLGLSTAASGLFEKNQLALELPSASPKATGKTLLVWGGSSSVGSNAIQLARAAGYEVVATASPRNFAYVQGLGAARVFDHHSPSVISDLIRTLQHRTVAGALAIGPGSGRACLDVLAACSGELALATATPPVSFDKAPQGWLRTLWLVPNGLRMVIANAAMAAKARRSGVRTSFIWGSALAHSAVGQAIYEDFLPSALAEARYLPKPDPLIVGRGLDAILAALETHKRGVSAQKVVVSL